jgi:predicted Zn-dependent peptidase
MDLRKWLQIMETYEGGGHAYHTTLPTDALQRLCDTMKETQARQNEINCQKTSFLAGRLLRKTLYGQELDYGYSLDFEWIEGLSTDVFQSNFQKISQTGPALVLCSGFADSDTQKQLRDWLLPFKNCQKVLRMGLGQLPKPSAGILWEPREDSQQSSLKFGNFCINSQDPDSALFSLTLEIFGGYFGSRLMSNIREDKGWTYGIYAQRVPNLGQPYMIISSDVKGENILDAIHEIKKEAEELKSQLVSDGELEKVKNYMIGQFLSSITNCYGLADRYRSMWLNGIDFERVENNQKEIQEATAEQVLKMAQTHLQLEDSVIALSGKVVS